MANARNRTWLAAACMVLAFAPALAPAAVDGPSVDEMIEALAPKDEASAEPVPRMRGFRPAARETAREPGKREGRLQLSVQFEFASAVISTRSRDLLLRLAEAMKSPALDGYRFRIEGHADARGGRDANQRLSERRAQSVLQFLASASHVEADRMVAVGMGSSVPLNPADPEAAENRRVVVIAQREAMTAGAPAQAAGSVEQMKGALSIRREGRETGAVAGARISEGDVLSTAAGTSALVRLDDGARLLLRADTTLRVTKLLLSGAPERQGQAFQLLVGAFRYVTGSLGKGRPEAIAFATATATVGVRGTDLDVVYAERTDGTRETGTYVRVNKGAVALGGLDGSVLELGGSEQAFAGRPKPVTRGGRPVPAVERLSDSPDVFQSGELDGLLERGPS